MWNYGFFFIKLEFFECSHNELSLLKNPEQFFSKLTQLLEPEHFHEQNAFPALVGTQKTVGRGRNNNYMLHKLWWVSPERSEKKIEKKQQFEKIPFTCNIRPKVMWFFLSIALLRPIASLIIKSTVVEQKIRRKGLKYLTPPCNTFLNLFHFKS